MSDFPLLLANENGVSRRTVQRWCETGKVPGAYRTKGGHWRLRKPRGGIKKNGKYDDNITGFVMRYTSDAGSKPPIPDFMLVNAAMRWVATQLAARCGLNPAPLTAEEARTFEWAKMILEVEYEKQMNELTASQEFNDALEFSTVGKGICDDDRLPKALKDIPRQERSRVVLKHFKDLEKRDPEKFRHLIGERDPETGVIRPTPMLELISERVYDAIRERHGMLMVKAEKLRLNKRKVTRASLARELGISVATLYRQFKLEKIRLACEPPCEPLPIAQPSQSTAAKKTVTINYNDEEFRDEGF
jgi:hypothetical protein